MTMKMTCPNCGSQIDPAHGNAMLQVAERKLKDERRKTMMTTIAGGVLSLAMMGMIAHQAMKDSDGAAESAKSTAFEPSIHRAAVGHEFPGFEVDGQSAAVTANVQHAPVQVLHGSTWTPVHEFHVLPAHDRAALWPDPLAHQAHGASTHLAQAHASIASAGWSHTVHFDSAFVHRAFSTHGTADAQAHRQA